MDKNKYTIQIKSKKGFWRDLWKLLEPTHKQMKILFFWLVAVLIVSFVGPYILKYIIDKLVDFNPDKVKDLFLLVALFLFVEQMTSFIHYGRDKRLFKLLFDIESNLSVSAQNKLVRLSLAYHEKENTGNKIMKIERGTQKIFDLVANLSWEVVPTVLQLVLTTAILFIIDWRFGVSLLVFAPAFVYSTYYSNKILYKTRKDRFKQYEEASGKMGQAIININTVKSFVQEERESREHEMIREDIKQKGTKEWYKLLTFWIYRNAFVDLGRSTVLIIGVYLVWRGLATVGTLVFVITLSEKSYFSLYRLSRFYDRVEEGAIAVKRFMAVINEKSEITNTENGLKPNDINGKIEFINVSFTYNDSKQKALNKVSLKIPAGCTTALVGPSGGGKTTVARMIYRHYDPQSGHINLDNNKLSNYDLYWYRKKIAIVPQEVEIFNSSVKENISYGRPNADFNEIEAAAKIANAEEFILQLKEKYNTKVGERGVKLSGGQRQRIGIARAILANPRILIFDEATSNLDSYSERLIQESMDKISKNRTVIIIAHRLSTIKKADKIFVLEKGSLVEEGSHIELSKNKGGLYAKLINLQKIGDVG